MQGLTLGHPALDIWTMVYSATDPEYRAAHLEADLRAYFTVLTTYMEEADPNFSEFMQEVEERRVYGMVLFSKLITYSRQSLCTWIHSQVGSVSSLCAPLRCPARQRSRPSSLRPAMKSCWRRKVRGTTLTSGNRMTMLIRLIMIQFREIRRRIEANMREMANNGHI